MGMHIRIVGHGNANSMRAADVESAVAAVVVALGADAANVGAIEAADGHCAYYVRQGVQVALHCWPKKHRYLLDVVVVDGEFDLRSVVETAEQHLGRGPRTIHNLTASLCTPHELKVAMESGDIDLPPTALDPAATIRYVEALKEARNLVGRGTGKQPTE